MFAIAVVTVTAFVTFLTPRPSCITTCIKTQLPRITDTELSDANRTTTILSPDRAEKLQQLRTYWTNFLDTIVQRDVYINDNVPKTKDPTRIKAMLNAVITQDNDELAETQISTVDGVTKPLVDAMGKAGDEFVGLYDTRYDHVLRHFPLSEEHYGRMRQKALDDLEAARQQMIGIYQLEFGGDPGDIPGEGLEYVKFEKQAPQ